MKRGQTEDSIEKWTPSAEESPDFRTHRRDADTNGSRSALAHQDALLNGTLKPSAKVIDKGPSEEADLQRKAIAALIECATTTLRLSEFLGEAGEPSAATCRYLGARIHLGASFNEQAHEFLESAGNFVLALASCIQAQSSRSSRPPNGAQGPRDSFQVCLAELSPTQRRAFDLLLKGLPNKLIAYELGLAESTVKTHMSSLFRKLHVRSRAHAIAIAADLERHNGSVSELESSRPQAIPDAVRAEKRRVAKRKRGKCPAREQPLA
jgi:DNA-binding CsgD family transcriptional regulator